MSDDNRVESTNWGCVIVLCVAIICYTLAKIFG